MGPLFYGISSCCSALDLSSAELIPKGVGVFFSTPREACDPKETTIPFMLGLNHPIVRFIQNGYYAPAAFTAEVLHLKPVPNPSAA